MSNSITIKRFHPEKLRISNSEENLHHIFEEADCYALWSAYAAGRPLLVRGKPGTGKSQMARAIAEQLGWAFVCETIMGSTELSDLHWHFDAIGRLGEAQSLSVSKGYDLHGKARGKFVAKRNNPVLERLNPLNFLSPGAFWWAYHWSSAESQYQRCVTRSSAKPYSPEGWTPETGGVVLLIDEIDKAEPDLPNGLLETLGSYGFTVPYLDQAPASSQLNPIKADPAKLLVIITTNEERELPKAFVRRCFVHTLKMEESIELIDSDAESPLSKRLQWLIERGQLHFGKTIAKPVYRQAAELLWQDRDENPHTQYPPGLAEYIDLLAALSSLGREEQQQRLDKICQYALKKELS
ncbi:AAA family ATPase [Methylomonas sp. 2BW1-5-20]|uniref:AAA family ATPase n=1 Tax=Methylomonas sp. 2BW1-5-20 TaxID=3376686 RepID=UPI00404DAB32